MRERKTYDEYDIEGQYEQGWEVVTCELTPQAARVRKREYDTNEPDVAHRIRKHRVKKSLQ